MQSFVKSLQAFGLGRLAALIGAGAGVAAVLAAVVLKLGGEPQSLLYANLDPKEAAQVTSTLDQAGIKYELKADGGTVMVARDKVASTRLLVAGKGLVTSGSVGYEIFDGAPALGQTDFVQQLNYKRGTEGELARTIKSIQGVSAARVLLNMPKKQLFEDDADAQASASIMVTTAGRRLGAEQVRAIRNLVAAAVPGLKPDRVAIADQAGDLLAGAGEEGVAAQSGERGEVEERIRRTVMNLVEGVVGPGRARVQVSADLDMSRVTTSEEKFDPDGQVVRSTQTTDDKTKEAHPGVNGGVSASQNLPGAPPAANAGSDTSDAAKTEETTNYEISKTTRTEVKEPGQLKRLSVSVAVDGVTGPAVHGKPGPYTPRAAQDLVQIDHLVKAAVGFDAKRGDVVEVRNVRFDPASSEAGSSAAGLALGKDDLVRFAELGVMLAVAALMILFVVRPLLASPSAAGAGGVGEGTLVGQLAAAADQLALPNASGQVLLAGAGAGPTAMDQRIDIARIEGQVKATSVKKVSEFIEKNPEASVAILRGWLHGEE